MNAAGRLTAFGAGLVAAFLLSYLVAGAVVPESAVTDWQRGGDSATHEVPESCGCGHEARR